MQFRNIPETFRRHSFTRRLLIFHWCGVSTETRGADHSHVSLDATVSISDWRSMCSMDRSAAEWGPAPGPCIDGEREMVVLMSCAQAFEWVCAQESAPSVLGNWLV